jgi:hypothetical protein
MELPSPTLQPILISVFFLSLSAQLGGTKLLIGVRRKVDLDLMVEVIPTAPLVMSLAAQLDIQEQTYP